VLRWRRPLKFIWERWRITLRRPWRSRSKETMISTCSYQTRPRLTRTNRGALWQNSGSKKRAS
jgi:hypothetical protein